MSNELDFWAEPKAIANFFIDKSDPNDPNSYIDVLKLNKLLYFSFGWASVFLPEKELFAEDIQAWKFGSVIPSIYTEFKNFKYNPINKKATDFNPETLDFDTPYIDTSKKDLVNFLQKMWNKYGELSASRLVSLLNAEGSPYSKYYKEDIKFTIIPKDEIKRYFNKYNKTLEVNNLMAISKRIIEMTEYDTKQGGDGISNLKLQKILFYLQKEYLKTYSTPLFNGKIEAWTFGAVVPEIYHKFKWYGRDCLDIAIFDENDNYILDDKKTKFIEDIYNKYKIYSGIYLSSQNTKIGSAWHKNYKKGKLEEIPLKDIKEDNTLNDL